MDGGPHGLGPATPHLDTTLALVAVSATRIVTSRPHGRWSVTMRTFCREGGGGAGGRPGVRGREEYGRRWGERKRTVPRTIQVGRREKVKIKGTKHYRSYI